MTGASGDTVPDDLAALVRAYLAADYRWQDADGAWRPLAVGMRAPLLEDRHPHAGAFGALTAWNPQSRARDEAWNRAADRRLRADLARARLAASPAIASDAAQAWQEPGWLVLDADVDAFDALARRYGQLGSLWWPRGEPVALRLYATRPSTVAADARMTWLGATPH